LTNRSYKLRLIERAALSIWVRLAGSGVFKRASGATACGLLKNAARRISCRRNSPSSAMSSRAACFNVGRAPSTQSANSSDGWAFRFPG
jgi:hypothetical protein